MPLFCHDQFVHLSTSCDILKSKSATYLKKSSRRNQYVPRAGGCQTQAQSQYLIRWSTYVAPPIDSTYLIRVAWNNGLPFPQRSPWRLKQIWSSPKSLRQRRYVNSIHFQVPRRMQFNSISRNDLERSQVGTQLQAIAKCAITDIKHLLLQGTFKFTYEGDRVSKEDTPAGVRKIRRLLSEYH